MSRKIIRWLGVVAGVAFIVFGLIVALGVLPNVPSPEWIYGMPVTFLGIAFFSYGISGKSRILGIK